eukprot:1988213-Amphidinium_carterae.1
MGLPRSSLQLELRFPLLGVDDKDRLQDSFKRPPLRIMSSEEIYLAGRSDAAAESVVAVRV